jgi:oxygen-independent coproporphyrinogen-3 oxidase
MMTGKLPVNNDIFSAYVHFPFCVRKCPYCDFVSYANCLEKRESYLRALCREIEITGQLYCAGEHGGDICQGGLKTVYMGGGTPSLFTPDQIGAVLDQLRNTYGINENAEITMEVNPGTVDADAFSGYKHAGVNRISIGVQSFSLRLLTSLGRIHTSEQAIDAIHYAKAAGFTNISCDLMTGLSGQTLRDTHESLTILLEEQIPHISFYALTLEEGTPFFEKYLEHEELLPSPELERLMYHTLVDRLKNKGYMHYEISNCAKPGFESRHNMTYWHALPYYGFGCGASSYTDNKRVRRTSDLSRYIECVTSAESDMESIITESETIDDEESKREFMLLGFRLMSGVSSEEFRGKYGISMESVFGKELDELMNKNLIACHIGQYFLSPKGLDFANQVFREFVV